MPMFSRYVGIDYSGADFPHLANSGIQVYVATHQNPPEQQQRLDKRANWSRKSLAQWLLNILGEPTPTIVGIDHAFSFPVEFLQEHDIVRWDDFLDRFYKHWQTDTQRVVDLRRNNAFLGDPTMFRLTDRQAPGAMGVFDFGDGRGIQKQVATSTHAGIPWLKCIREKLGERVHFWPFDDFHPTSGKSVVTEVYPKLFGVGYPRPGGLTKDQYDAWMTCSWLRDNDLAGQLGKYLVPPLNQNEHNTVRIEGWMLGLLDQA